MNLSEMQATIENSVKDKKLLAANHLKPFSHINIGRENIVIGKNGSGKTRFLRMAADIGNRNNWKVIGLDFAESRQLSGVNGKEIGRKVVWKGLCCCIAWADLKRGK